MAIPLVYRDDAPTLRVACCFFALGLINNILYVIILSAALDLVGPHHPKSLVLVANIVPSVLVKLAAPYWTVSASLRIACVVVSNIVGMTGIAAAAPQSVALSLCGVAMASAASGLGELTMLQVSTRYAPAALAAWSSGTGAAGVAGGLVYLAGTTWLRASPTQTLAWSAGLPLVMAVTYAAVLPSPVAATAQKYSVVVTADEASVHHDDDDVNQEQEQEQEQEHQGVRRKLALVRPLVMRYMMPLFLVYFAEYTINQGLSPTLLFDLRDMPFSRYRDAYPTYATLYQVGVFLSRSSSPWIRIRRLYLPSLGQCALLLVMLGQALFFFMPSIHLIFILILIEGLFGGLVYVNTFHQVSEDSSISEINREFSIGVIGVADSFGILTAALFSLWLEPVVCRYQVRDARPWCTLT